MVAICTLKFSLPWVKIDLNPQTQYSNIPIFQQSTAFDFGRAIWLWPGPEDQDFDNRLNGIKSTIYIRDRGYNLQKVLKMEGF